MSLSFCVEPAKREEKRMGLSEKTCVPCRGGVPPLTGEEIEPLARQVEDWSVVDNHHIQKSFTFPDFQLALEFVNKVGGIAEEQGHHPDIELSWGRAGVTIWTHKIDGLTESDFILAAKIDGISATSESKSVSI
jgi:4a-hydroxytetrahydrobiopterin dehydratase